MYRVTTLKDGTLTNDVDEFADSKTAIKAMCTCADSDYIVALVRWFDSGTVEPLVIHESSIYSDLWEHIP